MENLSHTPKTETAEDHRAALLLAQKRNQPLYDRLDNRPENKLRKAINEHVARAQGSVAVSEVVNNPENTASR